MPTAQEQALDETQPRSGPPPEPSGPGQGPPPAAPPPSPHQASWPAPTPAQQAPARGFPWKVVGVVVALALLGVAVLVVLAVGFVSSGRFTAHIDRANDYLDALRSDRVAAAAMLCPDARDPNAEALSTSTGQYLSEFDVSNGLGSVTGSVSFADGSSRTVQVETSGPTFPSGDDPATRVCIRATSLSADP